MSTYSGFSVCFLIAASLVEGWVPSVFRVFHFWQSAPRLNNTFSASTTEPPSHEPPQKGKAGIRHTEKCEVDKKRGRGEERNWLKETLWHKNAAQRNLTPHFTESRERRCRVLGMRAQTDHTPSVLCMFTICSSEEQITPQNPSLWTKFFAFARFVHLGVFFSTLLPRKSLHVKLCKFTISKQGLIVEFACLTLTCSRAIFLSFQIWGYRWEAQQPGQISQSLQKSFVFSHNGILLRLLSSKMPRYFDCYLLPPPP